MKGISVHLLNAILVKLIHHLARGDDSVCLYFFCGFSVGCYDVGEHLCGRLVFQLLCQSCASLLISPGLMNYQLCLGCAFADICYKLGDVGGIGLISRGIVTYLLDRNNIPMRSQKCLGQGDVESRATTIVFKRICLLTREHIAIMSFKRASAYHEVCNLDIESRAACCLMEIS